MPDFLALVLVFWNVHQSRRVGVGVAFVFGLLMDVHSGAVLGQHALAYTLLSFFAITIHRRLLWFTVPSQAVQILPLFLAAQAVSLLVRLIAGGMFPGWELILAPVFEALLWPVATWLLLAPQRRAPDPDENRPAVTDVCAHGPAPAMTELRNTERELVALPPAAAGGGAVRADRLRPARARASSTCRSSSTTSSRPRPRTTASRSCRSCPTAA